MLPAAHMWPSSIRESRFATAWLSAAPALELLSGWKTAWPLNANARGGNDDNVAGHTASGNAFFCSSVPSAIGSAFVESLSMPGNRYPLRRNCSPKGFSFGNTVWHVVHAVLYLRANAGTAHARSIP